MQENLSQTLAYIDEDEGPEVNISASEPGGSSCHGVTMEVLQEYNKAHGIAVPTLDDMKAMTAALAGTIFQWRYLDALRFNDLPTAIDYRLADAAISLGETGACLIAQMAMAMWPTTGIMDAATLAAIKAQEPIVLLAALDAAWLTWKRGLTATGWATFGHGWCNRIIKVRNRYVMMLK
jgi:lysozyme family protein